MSEVDNKEQSAEVFTEIQSEHEGEDNLEKKSNDELELALMDDTNIRSSKDRYNDLKKKTCRLKIYNFVCLFIFFAMKIGVASLFCLLYYIIMKERFFEILISYVVLVGLDIIAILFLTILPCVLDVCKKVLRK